jgi:predicted CoA-binding protein
MSAPSDTELRHLYAETRTIAVVGCSTDWSKAAHVVPAYLQSEGYLIVPVNPHEQEVLGERAFASLRDVDVPVDVVDVFRPPAEAPGIAAEAVAIGGRCLWLQAGIESEEAAHIAGEAGVLVVMNRCMGVTHGELGLGPGVEAWAKAHPPRIVSQPRSPRRR